MPPRIRPPHLVPLCEACCEHRHARLSPSELASLYEAERAAVDRRLTVLDEERRRLRARLQFLAPPTPREMDALRRMVGGEEETEDDRRLLRRRGWSYPMTTDTGDVLSGLGRTVAAAHGVEPVRVSLEENQP